MNGVEGLEQLDALLDALRGLGEECTRRVVEEAAPRVEKFVRGRVASGVDVDGKKFAPKKDGTASLVGAEKDVTVSASGASLVFKVGGHASWHQKSKGESASRPRRKLIPTGLNDIPKEVFEELRAALGRVATASLKGGGR